MTSVCGIKPDGLDGERSNDEWIMVFSDSAISDRRELGDERFHQLTKLVPQMSEIRCELDYDLLEVSGVAVALDVHRVGRADFNMTDLRNVSQIFSQLLLTHMKRVYNPLNLLDVRSRCRGECQDTKMRILLHKVSDNGAIG